MNLKCHMPDYCPLDDPSGEQRLGRIQLELAKPSLLRAEEDGTITPGQQVLLDGVRNQDIEEYYEAEEGFRACKVVCPGRVAVRATLLQKLRVAPPERYECGNPYASRIDPLQPS